VYAAPLSREKSDMSGRSSLPKALELLRAFRPLRPFLTEVIRLPALAPCNRFAKDSASDLFRSAAVGKPDVISGVKSAENGGERYQDVTGNLALVSGVAASG
jgi:hypothetical protein